jgi:MFS family permease
MWKAESKWPVCDSGGLSQMSRLAAWWAVFMFCCLFVVSYLDRLILALLVEPLQAELGISDTQFGIVFGTAFAVTFSLIGLVMGRAADVGNRKLIIVVCVMLWSIATTLSGFAVGFFSLFMLRMGVGIGEAALQPAALSMMSQMFPKDRIALPISIFHASGLLGGGCAFILGALALQFAERISDEWVVGLAPWRLTLMMVGVPGILLVSILLLTVKEPPRVTSAGAPDLSVRALVRELGSSPVYVRFLGGMAVLAVVNFGVAAWYPSVLVRSFGMPVEVAGLKFGLVAVISSVCGALVIPLIGQRLGGGLPGSGFPVVASVVALVGSASVVASCLSPSPSVSLAFAGFATFCLFGGSALAPISVQLCAPERMQGQIYALYLLATNLLGFGVGPILIAGLGAWFGGGASIASGLAITAATAGLLATMLLIASRRGYASHIGESFDVHAPPIGVQTTR